MIELMAYKCQRNDGHWFEDIIKRFQEYKGDPNPGHVHVELGFIGAQFGFRDGMMYSSSGRGKFLGAGTRFVSGDIDLEKWDIYPLILTLEQEMQVLSNSEAVVGAFYDWLGVIGMGLPWNIQLNKAFYCSEVVINECLAGIAKADPKIRPGQVLESLKKQDLIAA